MDEPTSEGVCVLKRSAALLLSSLLSLAFAATGIAQPAAEVPSSHPRLFADFPRPAADQPVLPYQDAWPDRWPEGPGPMGVILPLDNPRQFPEGVRSGSPSITLPPTYPAVQALTNAFPDAKPGQFAAAGPGKFVFRFVDPPAGQSVPRSRRNTASAMFSYLSAQPAALDGDPVLIVEQTWFALYDPASDKPARGVALVSPGLLGTPPGTLNTLTEELRKQGWAVLRMLAQPSRFTEEVAFELDPAGDLEAQAKHIAAVLGGRAAECAYAVEAAMAHVEALRPGLAGKPRIAVGFSGGAMTLPTIIAREPERYRAAVMVGGGADFWLINQRSNYRTLIRAIEERWKREPTPEELARLDELYLRNSPLDAYHTASALKSMKVLMIQGSADLAVPAPLGDLLWERLGRPDRWVEEAGHEALFMSLPAESFPRMMEWLNAAVPVPDTP